MLDKRNTTAPASWSEQNGPWLEAVGGATDAVRAARRAGWTLDKLAEQIRDHWNLADTLDRQDGAR